MEAILKCRQCSKKKQDLLFDQLNPPKLVVWWKKNTFYLRAGSLHRKYQKNSFFKGYIHLEWMTIVLINICVYPNNRKIWLYYESVDVNEINSKYDDPPVILQALDNIRFIYFILSNPSRIYDNGVSKYLCIRLVMTSDFPRCEHKWK